MLGERAETESCSAAQVRRRIAVHQRSHLTVDTVRSRMIHESQRSHKTKRCATHNGVQREAGLLAQEVANRGCARAQPAKLAAMGGPRPTRHGPERDSWSRWRSSSAARHKRCFPLQHDNISAQAPGQYSQRTRPERARTRRDAHRKTPIKHAVARAHARHSPSEVDLGEGAVHGLHPHFLLGLPAQLRTEPFAVK